MSSRKNVGNAWRITGSVWKAGKRIKKVEKVFSITCEQDLDTMERSMRDALYEEACKLFKKTDFSDVKIEVESEIDKSVGP